MVGWIGRKLSWVFGTVGVASAQSNQEVALRLDREARAAFESSRYNTTDHFDYALDLGGG